ncbi:MAG: phosphate ABC transporter substrate-binding protein [Thermoplasmatota archaeon]
MDERRARRAALGLSVLVIGMAALAGCIGGPPSGEKQILRIEGSTTVLPIVQRAAESYMDRHPDVDIRVSSGGSSVGIAGVSQGRVDIGMSSREVKQSEMEASPDLRPVPIARDGLAFVVHSSNTLQNITVERVRGIYNGTYTSWRQLGGSDTEIVVIGRDAASGTREYFHEAIMHKEDCVRTMLEKNSNGAVKESVAQTPGAIGYVGLGYVDASVRALKVTTASGNVEPTIANVRSGAYPVSRSLYLITKGAPSGLAKEFLDYVLSAEGQRIVEDEGFVPL